MWSIAKALQIPIDPNIKELTSVPFTISFVIRKRQQIDNLNELPKEKRPPEYMIWYGTTEEIDKWLDVALNNKNPLEDSYIYINEDEIES